MAESLEPPTTLAYLGTSLYSILHWPIQKRIVNCAALANVPGGPENCTGISGMSTQEDPALQGMIIISLRNYIAPGMTSGPDSSQLLTPRILTFTKP